MANTKQAIKRIRQNEKTYELNRSHRSRYRTLLKNFRLAISEKSKEKASEAFKVLVPVLDRYAGKKLFSKDKAARLKSQSAQALKKLILG